MGALAACGASPGFMAQWALLLLLELGALAGPARGGAQGHGGW